MQSDESTPVNRSCPACSTIFSPRHKNSKYCSLECREKIQSFKAKQKKDNVVAPEETQPDEVDGIFHVSLKSHLLDNIENIASRWGNLVKFQKTQDGRWRNEGIVASYYTVRDWLAALPSCQDKNEAYCLMNIGLAAEQAEELSKERALEHLFKHKEMVAPEMVYEIALLPPWGELVLYPFGNAFSLKSCFYYLVKGNATLKFRSYEPSIYLEKFNEIVGISPEDKYFVDDGVWNREIFQCLWKNGFLPLSLDITPGSAVVIPPENFCSYKVVQDDTGADPIMILSGAFHSVKRKVRSFMEHLRLRGKSSLPRFGEPSLCMHPPLPDYLLSRLSDQILDTDITAERLNRVKIYYTILRQITECPDNNAFVQWINKARSNQPEAKAKTKKRAVPPPNEDDSPEQPLKKRRVDKELPSADMIQRCIQTIMDARSIDAEFIDTYVKLFDTSAESMIILPSSTWNAHQLDPIIALQNRYILVPRINSAGPEFYVFVDILNSQMEVRVLFCGVSRPNHDLCCEFLNNFKSNVRVRLQEVAVLETTRAAADFFFLHCLELFVQQPFISLENRPKALQKKWEVINMDVVKNAVIKRLLDAKPAPTAQKNQVIEIHEEEEPDTPEDERY